MTMKAEPQTTPAKKSGSGEHPAVKNLHDMLHRYQRDTVEAFRHARTVVTEKIQSNAPPPDEPLPSR